jgi:YegS/Rv2252/BmrU family lipid kinase
MGHKKASLVINPRMGENIAKLTDIIAVLSAADWSTDIALKEFGGHTMELAAKAAEKDYDLVIAYGGDGTLNQVVNGVMNTKNQHSTVGIIPGGTANVWAGEVGVPDDPIKAALSLVGSKIHKVDIGRVDVGSLTFSNQIEEDAQNRAIKNGKKASKARHHFLLMAGLGIDAAIMSKVSKPLKYRIGPLAVGASAAKELPKQQPFPLEIRVSGGLREDNLLWKGEVLQVIIGNTRRYADIVEMTPNAYIDDGVLDVCVITAGNPLSTIQQISSLLLRRKPDNTTAEYFHGAHLMISAPASIEMQLDGSAVKLKDYLSKSDRKALSETKDAGNVMVNYRFDTMPAALQVAIPSTYNDTLFEQTSHAEPALSSGVKEPTNVNESSETAHEDPSSSGTQEKQPEVPSHIAELKDHGRKVSVVGVSHYQDKKGQTYIIAGGTAKKSTGETKPVAVRINGDTSILRHSGEQVPPPLIEKLPADAEIVVEGKQSKRGVIAALKVLI